MRTCFILFLCILSTAVSAQDERFFRDIFSGELYKENKKSPYKIGVESPQYILDLNQDGIEESFQTIKKDGLDFFRVNDPWGKKVFEGKLLAKGKNSSIFKVNFFNITHKDYVLVLHYYEGDNESSTFEGSARLYFITIQDKNLNKISMTKGPYFWSERERAAGKYWNKRFSVNTIDYNKDGIKEISVSFNKTTKLFYYVANGVWTSL